MEDAELQRLRKRATDLGNAAVVDGLPPEEALRKLAERRGREPDRPIPPPPDFAALGTTFHGGYTECSGLLRNEHAMVRRAAAGALAKFIGSEPSIAGIVKYPLLDAIGKEDGEQTLQYMLRALELCADAMEKADFDGIRDIARNPAHKSYVREAAAETIAAVERRLESAEARGRHWCTRCRKVISEEESAVSFKKYFKPYCRHCFGERQHEDAEFTHDVEAAKKLVTTNDVAVQSKGEKKIGDWLAANHIDFVYDERMVIAGGVRLRPDFYLPEFDVYIEYWGMDTPEYVANMEKERFYYQREHKKLISLSFRDFANLETLLKIKLSRYGVSF